MEDDPAESEWAIQEYSPYSKQDKSYISMVKWILDKGYGIGKNMVITGVAISSAPIVVPPLVFFSAMGYAFSVPFGVGFATYACTNKIMSTLLPIPSSLLMLEYYEQEQHQGAAKCRFELDDGGDDYRQIDEVEQGYYIDEYDDDGGGEVEYLVTNVDRDGDGDVDEERYYIDEEENEEDEFGLENVVEEEDKEIEDHVVQRKNVVIDEEEKEQMEDIKQGADIVFYTDEGGYDFEKQGEASNINVDENVDEGSNHVNQNVDDKEMEDHVSQRENVVIEEEEKEQMEDIKQGVEMRLGLDVSGEDQGYEEDVGEYLEGDDDNFEDESKGKEPLIESQIDENKSYTWEVTENEMEENAEGDNGLSENIRDEGSVNNTVEDDYFLDESALVFEDARDVEITEPVMVKEIDSQKLIMDGSTNNETVISEMRHIVILAEGNEANNFNARELEELDLVAREVMGDMNKKARNTESDEEVKRKSMGTQEEKTGGYTSNDGSEDAILRTKKEQMIHSYADAREIGDESGLDLFDERKTNIHFASLEADDEGKENIADENVDFVALPAFKRTPLATENGKAVSKTKTNTKMPSREDILDEERIWEKIGAMRTIVGYKAPSQPACIGELKALYVFTGVEPPASFKDDSDLDEVNAKLKFLMSIVGVK